MATSIAEITTFLDILRTTYGAPALHALVDRLEHAHRGIDPPPLPSLESAEDLITEAGNLPPMLVDRLLPDNSLFLLTGKPKAGKSFLALDIAEAVSQGAPVFGQLPVSRPGPVLYLAMEDGKQELARRLNQRCQEPGTRNLYFIAEPFTLTDPLNLARVRELATSLPATRNQEPGTRNRASLLVIDTAAEALDIRDWINRAEILAKIAPLRRLARELCTILLVAHNRKAEGDGGDEIAGSNALAGAVDGWISAHKVERRPNGNRRLHLRIEGRGGVGHALIAEMDSSNLRFALIPDEEAEAQSVTERQSVRAARHRERRRLLLGILADRPAGATIAELAASMGVAYSVAWPVVRELTAEHRIEETGQPAESQGGRRPPTYRLTVPEETSLENPPPNTLG